MKVSFSVPLKPSSGKQNFAVALAHSFRKKGVKVVKKNPDINLVFVKGVRKGCINIMRLDGAWINNKMNSKSKNEGIRKHLRQCHGVIYQSTYSKTVCQKFIGKLKRNTIILNGCDPTVFNTPYENPKPYLLCCSRWRPHKRLKVIVSGFLESGLQLDYDLVVCGDPDYTIDHPSVKYLGVRSRQDIFNITVGCSGIVHLAFLDCCPNSVVEGLVAGKNVLHTNSGGTHELVGPSGVCIEDGPFSFRMIDLYSPPALSMPAIVDGMKKIVQMPAVVREDLFIDNVADQYIAFMRKFLR